MLAVVVVAVSIAWAVLRLDITDSYFDPVVRAWELAVGALSAVVPVRFGPARASVAWIAGLGLIVLGAVAAPASVVNPLVAALPAVLGTVLVVASGAAALAAVTGALTSAPVRALGRASYSLYLWHFPCLVFAESLLPGRWWGPVVAAVASVPIAFASRRWIEEPFLRKARSRRSRTASDERSRTASDERSRTASDERSRKGQRQSGRRRAGTPRRRRGRVVAAVAVSPLVLVAACAQVAVPQASDTAAAGASAGLLDPVASARPATAAEVTRSLRTEGDRSAIDRALDGGFTNQFAPEMSSTTGCRNELGSSLAHARVCSAGPRDAARIALVIGDSIAMSWVPAIRSGLVPVGWRVVALGFASCAPADAGRTPTEVGDRLCDGARERMLAEVDRIDPDLVVVSNDDQAFTRTVDGDAAGAERAWTDSTARLIDRIGQRTERVVLLGAPPRGANPVACATRPTGVSECAPSAAGDSGAVLRENQAATVARAGAVAVDVTPWFCADGSCPVVADGVLVRVNDRHLTNAYSQRLALVMRSALLQ